MARYTRQDATQFHAFRRLECHSAFLDGVRQRGDFVSRCFFFDMTEQALRVAVAISLAVKNLAHFVDGMNRFGFLEKEMHQNRRVV
ncbi:MAG TPA: hypothetical protein VK840_06135 [Candidatus Dormibacteraeota bacterium]|nr:hypothetical protein [Candidatus Dormibacteraeota bacterium]